MTPLLLTGTPAYCRLDKGWLRKTVLVQNEETISELFCCRRGKRIL